ncbi:hypothetical protein [Streptomyces sp. NPDC013740]|uniref:phage tail protein n=1 Tax=Streptomyces sp. NPDC013740 TaxID=3364867 RepID=UPI0036FF5A62
MALNVGELVGLIRADDSGMRRGLANAELRMRGFRRDVESQLRQVNHRFRDFDWGGLARRARPHFAQIGQVIGRFAQTAGAQLGKLGLSLAKVGLAVGSAVPAVSSLVAAVAKVGPAAAVAVSGMLAMRLAAGALKLGMIGVEDAITAALDPEKAEDFEKALAKLAPNAAEFAREVKKLAPELQAVQQSVQNRLFENFAGTLQELSRTVLPSVRRGLEKAAMSLNRMALGAAAAAEDLGRSGALGKAIQGANDGLQNLERVPGRVVTGLGQLGAAAAPAFDRLTKAVDRVTEKIADKLNDAFQSGALERAIDGAIDALDQLLGIAGNFAKGIGNIFKGVTKDGGGLFDILEKISEAFARLTASKEFQSILNQLSMTAGTLVDAILPLLLEAFVQLAPVIDELAPVVRDFITAIGPELVPIIQELGPVLVDLAEILRDQLPMAIEITKAAIDVIVIALQALHWVLENVIQPAVKAVADVFNSDYARALRFGSQLTATKLSEMGTSYNNFRQRVVNGIMAVVGILGVYASNLRDRFVRATVERVAEVVRFFQGLPGRIRGALGNLGGLLYSAGQAVVRGFLAGIRSMIGALRSQLSGITNMIPDLKGPPEKDARLLTPAGRSVIAGFQRGIAAQVPALQQQLAGITTALPGMAMGPMAAGTGAYGGTGVGGTQTIRIVVDGPQAVRSLIRTIVQEDGRGDVQVAFGQR